MQIFPNNLSRKRHRDDQTSTSINEQTHRSRQLGDESGHSNASTDEKHDSDYNDNSDSSDYGFCDEEVFFSSMNVSFLAV